MIMKGLKGLKGLNQQLNLNDVDLALLKISNNIVNRLLDYTENLNPTLVLSGTNNFGESRYDPKIANVELFEDLGQYRANTQPWYDKVLAGTAKGAVLAGTTFIDSFAGTLAGLFEMGATGKFSGLWDNPVSNYLNSINESMEKILPTYYSNLELLNNANGEWYKNIFTANFLGDAILKNTGFMVGAALSGKVTAGAAAKMLKLADARKAFTDFAMIANTEEGLSAALKIAAATTGDAAIDGSKLILDSLKMANKIRRGEQQLKIIGATTGAIGEARLEAILNSNDYERLKELELQSYLPALVEQETNKLRLESPDYVDNEGHLNNIGKLLLNDRVNSKIEKARARILEDKTKFGNRDFVTNVALLAGSDYVQFGRMYAGGFKNASREANILKNIGKEGTSEMYSAAKPSILKKMYTIAKTPIMEGPVGEMGLAAIAKTLNQYYGANFNSFIGHLVDPNANKESIDWLNAIGEGVKQQYGNMAGWEDGFIGALMGGFGMPMILSNKVDGKTKRKIILNGSIGEMLELNELTKEDLDLAERLNNRFQDPKFLEYYKALVRRNSFENDKQEALDNKDEFEYKNAEHSSLISDAILFDKAGRILDLYDVVNSMSDISDDDIKNIRENLTSLNKETIPYLNKTDEELKQYFKDKAADIKASIDSYKKIADDLAVKVGDKFRGDDLSELTWMLTKIDNWENRFRETYNNIKEDLEPALESLSKVTYEDVEGNSQPITNLLNESPGSVLNVLHDENIQLLNNLKKYHSERQDDTEILKAFQELKINDKEDNRGKASMIKKLDKLLKTLETHKTASTNIDNAIDKLKDIKRLAAARTSFLVKYYDYILNPNKLQEDKESLTAEANQDLLNELELNLINKEKDLKDITSYKEYKEHLDNLVNEDKDFDAVEYNNRLIRNNNEFAKLHKNMSNFALSIKNNINKYSTNKEDKDNANYIYDLIIKNSETPELLYNPNNSYLIQDTIKDDGELIDPLTKDRLVNIIRKAMLSGLSDVYKHKLISPENISDGAIVGTIGEDIPSTNKDLPPIIKDSVVTNTKVSNNLIITENLNIQQNIQNELDIIEATNAYYKPSIPQINKDKAIKEGIVEPFYIEKSWSKELYNYFEEQGTFDYLNNLNVKEGDTVKFLIDENFRKRKPFFKDIIFITHGKTNQIIGSLDEKYASSFIGLKEMRERIEKQHSENGIITETTKIGKINSGYLNLTRGNERDLKDVKNLSPDKLLFAVASYGLDFYFENTDIPKTNLVAPKMPGLVYLYIPSGDGRYLPAPCRIKSFNNRDFNLNDVVTRDNPIIKRIDGVINDLANVKSNKDVDKAYNSLSKLLVVGTEKDASGLPLSLKLLKINLSKDGNTLIISLKDLIDGEYSETKATKIYLNKYNQDPSIIGRIDTGERNLPEPIDKDIIKKLIYDAILDMELLFNIDAKELNSGLNNNKLLNANILTTALTDAIPQGVWFYMLAKDKDGNLIPFVTPTKESDNIEKAITSKQISVNPVKVTESIPGTPVRYKGDDYYVNNGVVYNTNNEEVNSPLLKNLIKDLAYIKDGVNGKFGKDWILNHKLNNDEYIILDGSIFNIKDFTRKNNNLKIESTSSTSFSSDEDFEIDDLNDLILDSDFLGSNDDIYTDFKNVKTNSPKNLENSNKFTIFADIEEDIKKSLIKKGFTEESWSILTNDEKEHEIKCVKN